MKLLWKVISLLSIGLAFFGYDIDNGAAAIFAYAAIVFAMLYLGEKE